MMDELLNKCDRLIKQVAEEVAKEDISEALNKMYELQFWFGANASEMDYTRFNYVMKKVQSAENELYAYIYRKVR